MPTTKKKFKIRTFFCHFNTMKAIVFVVITILASYGGAESTLNETQFDDEQLKSMVAILEKNSPICAGALINQEYVVTTASCIMDKSDLMIATESAKPKDEDKKRLVTNVVVHPNYRRNSFDYDVAVLRIAPFESSTFEVLQLAEIEPNISQIVLTTGWVPVEEQNFVSEDSQIVERVECKKLLKNKVTLTGKLTCVGTKDGPVLFTVGSPLIGKDSNILYGIAVHNFNLSEIDSPNLYVNVANSEIKSFLRLFVANLIKSEES